MKKKVIILLASIFMLTSAIPIKHFVELTIEHNTSVAKSNVTFNKINSVLKNVGILGFDKSNLGGMFYNALIASNNPSNSNAKKIFNRTDPGNNSLGATDSKSGGLFGSQGSDDYKTKSGGGANTSLISSASDDNSGGGNVLGDQGDSDDGTGSSNYSGAGGNQNPGQDPKDSKPQYVVVDSPYDPNFYNTFEYKARLKFLSLLIYGTTGSNDSDATLDDIGYSNTLHTQMPTWYDYVFALIGLLMGVAVVGSVVAFVPLTLDLLIGFGLASMTVWLPFAQSVNWDQDQQAYLKGGNDIFDEGTGAANGFSGFNIFGGQINTDLLRDINMPTDDPRIMWFLDNFDAPGTSGLYGYRAQDSQGSDVKWGNGGDSSTVQPPSWIGNNPYWSQIFTDTSKHNLVGGDDAIPPYFDPNFQGIYDPDAPNNGVPPGMGGDYTGGVTFNGGHSDGIPPGAAGGADAGIGGDNGDGPDDYSGIGYGGGAANYLGK